MNEILENNIYKRYIKSVLKKDDKSFCIFRRERQMDYLFSFLKKDFKKKDQKILDACCGYGRLIYFLNEFDSKQLYFGIDYVEELIKKGKNEFFNYANIKFECCNVLELSKQYKKKFFDISINYKTLSWLPYYEKIIKELVKVTKDKIYITSLFCEGDIDFITKIYVSAMNNKQEYIFLNNYSLPKFKRFCKKLGVKKIDFVDMKLDFDLPKISNVNKLNTYTVVTKDDNRLEITGNIILNWKLVVITL